MSKRTMVLSILACAALLLAGVPIGCGGDEKPGPTVVDLTPSEDTPEAGSAGGAETIESKLAAADALDGKVDKVVTRCASCALHMDGSTEHELEFAGYTFCFCQEACKERFEKDPEKKVLALKIPTD